jgi:hypothetical protein
MLNFSFDCIGLAPAIHAARVWRSKATGPEQSRRYLSESEIATM